MESHADRTLGKAFVFVLLLSMLVGLVMGLIGFGGLSRSPANMSANTAAAPAPTRVAANDPSGAYLLGTAPSDTPIESGPLPGKHAPDFSLTTLEGRLVRLSDYHGRRVLVNFWASWCIPCREEAPTLQAAYEQYDDFVVLGVNVLDNEADATAFASEFGFTFPLPVDAGEHVMRAYRVRGIPTSFFVDREGIIRFVHIGPLSVASIDDYLFQIA